ncbi:DNA polymerase III, delta subunit [Spirosomataceae bacterium TFI 002]|nr:DNA polymerase III, delta subunit [Spirosomataceae bacterium TFI 002]
MAAKTPQQVIQELGQNKIKPLYILHGDENFFLDQIGSTLLQNVIPEHEKGFNEVILYGKDISVGDLLNNARRFPMMAEKQLVYVREAHSILDINNKDSQSLLESYAKNPLASTVLVMHFGKSPDARKAWLKAASTNGEVVASKRIYDNQVPDFIASYCKAKGIQIAPKAIHLLFEQVGNNLEAISKEIDKIAINLKNGGQIDANIIEEFVGISKDFNVFELQKAITFKDRPKCFQIINYFASNTKDHPIQPVITMLFAYFTKVLLVHASPSKDDRSIASLLRVNPFFVKDYTSAARNYNIAKIMAIIHALRISDQNSKGVENGTKTEGDIYKELIFSILN